MNERALKPGVYHPMYEAWRTAVAEGHTIDSLDGWIEFELQIIEDDRHG